MSKKLERCAWAVREPAISYHDTEWGVPIHDDRALFELLILEGAQAGLSWDTILKKRDNYREAFDNFDPVKIARYTPKRIEKLLQNPGIVRNRLKVNSAVRNAKVFLAIAEEFGSFDAYLWRFVDGMPIQNRFRKLADIPAKTELSDAISKDLKKCGMNFVGSTIVYAYMQSAGLANDHVVTCPRYAECAALA